MNARKGMNQTNIQLFSSIHELLKEITDNEIEIIVIFILNVQDSNTDYLLSTSFQI